MPFLEATPGIDIINAVWQRLKARNDKFPLAAAVDGFLFSKTGSTMFTFLVISMFQVEKSHSVLARQLNVYIPKAQHTKVQSRPVPTTAHKRLPRKERKRRKLLLSILKQTQKPSPDASSSTKPITKRRIKKNIQAKFQVPSSKFQVSN